MNLREEADIYAEQAAGGYYSAAAMRYILSRAYIAGATRPAHHAGSGAAGAGRAKPRPSVRRNDAIRYETPVEVVGYPSKVLYEHGCPAHDMAVDEFTCCVEEIAPIIARAALDAAWTRTRGSMPRNMTAAIDSLMAEMTGEDRGRTGGTARSA